MLVRSVTCLAFAALACATGGEHTSPSTNLPHTDVVPVHVAEVPLALAVEDADVGRPWAASAPDGSVTLWFGLGGHVARARGVATATGLEASVDDPDALVPAFAWEAGLVGEPSVAGGLMAYTGGDGAGIGLATSEDGLSFAGAESPVLVPTEDWEAGHVASPSLVPDPERGRTLLFYAGGRGAGVGVAASVDGATFTRLLSTPVLAPLGDLDPKAFDAGPFAGASVTRRATPLDRSVFELWYAAGGALGTASSFDGVTFSRFALNPVLSDSGFDLASPMRADGLLLHVRNVKKGTAAKGRGLGVAVFGVAPTPTGVDAAPR